MSGLVIPKRIDFKLWATQLIIDLPDFDIPYPEDEEHWWDWAAQIITRNNLTNIPVPSDKIYKKPEDWVKWASFFIDSVNK